MSRATIDKPPADLPDERAHRVMIAEYVRAQHIPYLDHEPTNGSYARGDLILNSEPTAAAGASAYVGWVCVQSGTFGLTPAADPVFKTYGGIS